VFVKLDHVSYTNPFLNTPITVYKIRYMSKDVLTTIIWFDKAISLVLMPPRDLSGTSIIVIMPVLTASTSAASTAATAAITATTSITTNKRPVDSGHFNCNIFFAVLVIMCLESHQVTVCDAAIAIMKAFNIAEDFLASTFGLDEAKTLVGEPPDHPAVYMRICPFGGFPHGIKLLYKFEAKVV